MLSQSIPSKKGWFLKSSIPFCPSLCSILQQSLQHNKTDFTLYDTYTDTYQLYYYWKWIKMENIKYNYMTVSF